MAGPEQDKMTKTVFALILTSVVMSALAQIVLKAGMSSSSVLAALAGSDRWQAAWAVGTNIKVLGGLFIYFASALVWLLVLSRVQVSLAYPFVALGFILTMVLGWWVHDDTLSVQRVLGTVLIAAGAVMVGRS
jgi:drug/metabolite transporter (DMT)-like permease